jgi:hypothetical protein
MGEKAQCTWAVHEHFEPISNAAWRRQRIFQQPARSQSFAGMDLHAAIIADSSWQNPLLTRHT